MVEQARGVQKSREFSLKGKEGKKEKAHIEVYLFGICSIHKKPSLSWRTYT